MVSGLQAQTWDGGGGDANWTTGLNWVSNLAPVANDSLVFDGAVQVANTNDFAAGTQFNGLTFAPTAGVFVIGGNSINLGGNIVNNSANTQTLNMDLALLQNTTYSGPGSAILGGGVSGAFDLTKTGSGTLTLNGTNLFSGQLVVQQGTLALGAAGSLAASEIVLGGIHSANSGATLAVSGVGPNTKTLNGVTFKSGGRGVITSTRSSGSGTFTLALGTLTREVGSAAAFTVNSNTAITTTNTNTNGILGGWATVGNNFATVNGSNQIVAYSGYTVPAGTSPTVADAAASNVQITNTNALTAPTGVSNTSGTAVVSMADTTGLVAGDALSGTGVPAGATILSVDSATQITMSVNSSAAVTALSVYHPVVMAGSGTTDINTLQTTDTNNRVVNIGAGNTLRLGQSGAIWRAPTANSLNRLTIENGSLTAGGAVNAAGEIVITANGDNSTFSGGQGSRANVGIAINSNIVNNGAGAVTLTKNGPQVVQLNGTSNTYSGGTYVVQGSLQSTVAGNLGTGDVYVTGAGTDTNFAHNSGGVWLTGTGNYANNFYVSGLGPQQTITGGNGAGNTGAIRFGGSGAVITGTVNLMGDTRMTSLLSGTGTINGKITGTGQLDFGVANNNANGTLVLGNAGNDWVGGLRISAGGTGSGATSFVNLGASGVLPDSQDVTLDVGSNNSGSANFSLMGFNETINALNSAGTGTAGRNVRNSASAASTATLTVGAGNGNGSFSGTITNGNASAVLNFAKTGTGTQILSGTNSYTGTTVVNGGTLLVSGTLTATGSVTASAGGTFRYDNNSTALNRNVTLDGGKFSYNSSVNYAGTLTFNSGTIGGSNISNLNLTIGSGQIMAPGNSTGTMAAGATTWANGGTFLFEINDATGTAGSTTAGWDLLNAASLDITAGAGQFTIQIASLDSLQVAGTALNFNDAGNYSWLFVDAGSAITNFNASQFVFTDSFVNSTTGTFSISQGTGLDTDKLYINYSAAIPEPGTYAMLLGGLGLLAFLRRRSKS